MHKHALREGMHVIAPCCRTGTQTHPAAGLNRTVCVCVRTCVCVRVCECVCACVRVCVRVSWLHEASVSTYVFSAFPSPECSRWLMLLAALNPNGWLCRVFSLSISTHSCTACGGRGHKQQSHALCTCAQSAGTLNKHTHTLAHTQTHTCFL
jgi:hypothetical protein